MSDNKHTGGSRSSRGYYIALVLCAAAIGITSYVYYQNTPAEEEVLLQEPELVAVGTMDPEENVPVIATQPRTEPVPDTTAQPETASPTQPGKRKVQLPVSGQEIYGYSMETLSYNQTTRDWRVHNGVDIAAAAGTEVVAAADGVVYTTYTDDSYGTTVVIRHQDSYTTHYSSLAEELKVSAGDTVQMGQVIGCVGSTALIENALGDHVHFSVTYQDAQMDPAEFLSLGN